MNNFFNNLLNSINEYIPNTLGVIIIIIIGVFIAKLLRRIITKLVAKTGIDDKMGSSKLTLSKFIGKLVYFLIMIFVFMIALEKLGMTSALEPVKELLGNFTGYIGNIIGAGVVGYIGYILAIMVSELVGLSGETIQKLAPKLKLPENINLVSILKKVVFIFIFIPLLITALNILKLDAISEPATTMLQTFFEAIPKILIATIIMIVFVFGGRFLSELIKDLLHSLNLNELMNKAHLGELAGKTNIEKLIANIVYAFIILFGLMTAVDKLGFEKLSEIVSTIVDLSGNILFGLVILAIGNWIANLASKYFLKSDNNPFIGNIIKIAIMTVFLAISLRKMGIANEIVNLTFGITLGAIALTIVLSFGLGGREAAGKQMGKILDKFNKK